MPPCDITWYDGVENTPPFPEGYESVEATVDNTIPPPGGASAQGNQAAGAPRPQRRRRNTAGKIIYSKELTFKGGTHSAPLFIIPEEKAKEMASQLPEYPESPSNHYENFLKACLGEEKTRSPFEIFAPLSQIFSLGVVAMRRNEKLIFDDRNKEIINDKFANSLLTDRPPRIGWESYYKV